MSFHATAEPSATDTKGSIELLIEPSLRDLGEFSVRRVLPSPERRMVGPFIFFDHMGPAEFPPGQGVQVRPHPHICLATVTYLFEGEIIHRDSLGYVQPIRPGAVNLMTAGRGIVHSERAGDDLDRVSHLHGIQSWLALPDGKEECEPTFEHIPATEIPALNVDGVDIKVIMGSAFGETSPVTVFSDTLYLECVMPEASTMHMPRDQEELAIYIVSGEVSIDGRELGDGVMAVARSGRDMHIHAKTDCRVMVIGGEHLGKRHIWWNFVASSRERIEQAKSDWENGRYDSVPGDDEFIPLPDD